VNFCKPYLAQVTIGGSQRHLGSYATAEEAALEIARAKVRAASCGL